MPPLRRYLRITRHSVLETRIYFEDPTLALPFIRQPNHPLLAQLLKAVQPLILPKLREERDRRAKGKGKKKGVKDVVQALGGEWEVLVFLVDVETRHAVVVKSRTFREGGGGRRRRKGAVWGGDKESAVDVDGDTQQPVLVRDESDDEDDLLDRLPTAPPANSLLQDRPPRTSEEEGEEEEEEEPEKKKLALTTEYNGYAIYGKTLCLVVQKKTPPRKITDPPRTAGIKRGEVERKQEKRQEQEQPQPQGMVSDWIASTQAVADLDLEDDG